MPKDFRRFIYTMAAVSFLILLFSIQSGASEPSKTVLFVAPIFNIQGTGISVDSIEQIGKSLINTVEKRTGYKVAYEKVGDLKLTQRQAMDALIERMRKSGDMSWMDYPSFRRAVERGLPLEALALVEIEGELSFSNCFYVRKDAKMKKIEDLRGGKISGGTIVDWVALRLILYENGIEEQPEKFFGEMMPVTSIFTAFNMLITGKIDTFVIHEPLYNVIRKSNPNYEKIVPLACARSAAGTLIPVGRKGLEPGLVQSFRGLLLNAHRDPDLGIVRPFIEAAGLKFVEVTPERIAVLDAYHDLAVKKGWYAEAEEYARKSPQQARRKQMDKCRKECTGATPQEVKICYRACEERYGEEKKSQ